MSRVLDNLRMLGQTYNVVKNDAKTLVRFVESISANMPHWSEESRRALQAECLFASKWVVRGEIVYRLSHSLAALFAMTSAPPIDWEHLPHEAFVIQVPRKFLPLDTELKPRADEVSIYVHNYEAILVPDHDTTGRVMGYSTDATVSFENLHRDYSKMSDGIRDRASDPGAFEELKAHAYAQLSTVPFMADFSQDMQSVLIDAAVHNELQRYEQIGINMAQDKPKDRGFAIVGNRFVSNVLAYLSEATKAGAVAKRSSPASAGTLIDLLPPQHVVVKRDMRDAAQDVVEAVLSGSMAGIRRAMRHHVRGHYRQQAHGPGHSQRRSTWIFPHERGSEDLGKVVRRIETMHVPIKPTNN